MVIADVLGKKHHVERNVLLVARRDVIRKIEPGFHARMNELGLIVKRVHDLFRTEGLRRYMQLAPIACTMILPSRAADFARSIF